MGCHVEPKAKHLASVREILRFAQNDTPHFICDGPVVLGEQKVNMDDKTSFWGTLAIPWAGKNPYRLALYLLVFIYLLDAALLGFFLLLGQADSFPVWFWFILFPALFPLPFLVTYLIIGRLIKNLVKKLPDDASLRSDCIVLHGFVQSPGIVQITGDTLIIQPLVGRQISLPIREISQVSEHRWWNGQLYLGRTCFFKLKVPPAVSTKLRLGFGVADGDPWREVLHRRNR